MMRDSKKKGKKTRRPKMKLGLPDLDQAKSAVLSSLRSPSRNAAIDIPSTNSSLGIVPSRASLSTKPSHTHTSHTHTPRRSPRMTHFCSFEVTHTKNKIWRGTSVHQPRERLPFLVTRFFFLKPVPP